MNDLNISMIGGLILMHGYTDLTHDTMIKSRTVTILLCWTTVETSYVACVLSSYNSFVLYVVDRQNKLFASNCVIVIQNFFCVFFTLFSLPK